MPDNSFYFAATGIGSLPHRDPDLAVEDILTYLLDMPYWPQLSNVSALEDMNLMYAGALAPLVKADVGKRALAAYPETGREQALAEFYQRLWEGDGRDFGLTEKEASGFFAFLRKMDKIPLPEYPWIKGHVTGPLTVASSVLGSDGKSLLYDEEMAQAIAAGLGAAAAAQLHQMAHLGRKMVMFFDEPFLSGYGSAFTPVNQDTVAQLLNTALEETKRRTADLPVSLAVHCCGRTDWSLLLNSGADIVNLDSAGFGDSLLLYRDMLPSYFEMGNIIAWGAVPTTASLENLEPSSLWDNLKSLLKALEEKGISRETIGRQAMITPACGLSSLSQDKAVEVLKIMSRVVEFARSEYLENIDYSI